MGSFSSTRVWGTETTSESNIVYTTVARVWQDCSCSCCGSGRLTLEVEQMKAKAEQTEAQEMQRRMVLRQIMTPEACAQ